MALRRDLAAHVKERARLAEPVRFFPRAATAAVWTAAKPVLLDGEEGLEIDTGQRKLGDGSTPWPDLEYLPNPSATSSPSDPGTGASLPSGGSPGQVLTKLSSADGDAGWEDIVLDGGTP